MTTPTKTNGTTPGKSNCRKSVNSGLPAKTGVILTWYRYQSRGNKGTMTSAKQPTATPSCRSSAKGGRDAKQCGVVDLPCLRPAYETEDRCSGRQQGEGVRAGVDGGKHNQAVDNEHHGRDHRYAPGKQLPRTAVENVGGGEHGEDRRNPQHNFPAAEDGVRGP